MSKTATKFTFIILALSIVIFLLIYFLRKEKEVYYICLLGPVNDSINFNKQAILTGAEIAIEEINNSNLPENVEIRLSIYDDKSNKESSYLSAEKAKEIIENPRNIAVVGNFFPLSAKSTVPIFQKSGIPVIIPTIQESEKSVNHQGVYHISTSCEFQSKFIANYVNNVLQLQKVAVVYSETVESKSSKDAFIEEFEKIANVKVFECKIPDENFNPELLSIYSKEFEQSNLIYLPLESGHTLKVIKYLKNNGYTAQIFGDSHIGNDKFLTKAGGYCENVFSVNTYLKEISGENASYFNNICKANYRIESDINSIHTYESVKLIGEAVKLSGASKKSVAEYLEKQKERQEKIQTITGEFSFNKEGFSSKLPKIGRIVKGKYISADYQLVENSNPKLPANSITFGNLKLVKSTVVTTGVHVKNIESFEIFDSKYSAELLVWFNWNTREIKKFDFEIENGVIKSRDTLEYHVNDDGMGFASYKISGNFTNDFLFYDYPFDNQTLKFSIIPQKLSTDQMIWVNDLNRNTYFPENLDLGEWNVSSYSHYISSFENFISIGNPEFNNKIYKTNKTGFTYNIGVSRIVEEYLAKLVPLIIVIVVAFLSFFLHIGRFAGSRIALGVTSFLSAVAFQMSQSGSLENIGYITKSDYFYMITYSLIFAVVLETVIANRIFESGRHSTAERIDKFSGLLFPIVSICAIFYIYN